MADNKPNAPQHGGTVDIYNRGNRTYVLGKDKDGKSITLEPNKSVSVPHSVAKQFIGEAGYDDLIDASKVAPGARKREDDLKAENERLRAENERLMKAETAKVDKKTETDKGGNK